VNPAHSVVTREEWRARLADAWPRLRGGELTPLRAALSVAVGLAIGVTPLYGLHFFLVLGICLPLRLDVAVAYLAANISLPFVAPLLAFTEIQLGNVVLSGHLIPLHMNQVRLQGASGFLRDLIAGTLVFSPALALAGGLSTYALVRRFKREDPAALKQAIESVALRYGRSRPAAFYYVRTKLSSDPVARAIVAMGQEHSLGDVVDVGCGRGQILALLLEMKAASRVTGFDWDPKKLEDGRHAAGPMGGSVGPLALEFEVGDARTHPIPPCDTVLLIDVLHYFTDEEQTAMIARAADAARSRVLVRELDPDRGWRSFLTRVQEAVTTKIRFNKGARVRVRPIRCVVDALDSAGFDVTVEPCWGSTPLANVLVIATRRSPSDKAKPPASRP
jgi:uncharacterized protein (DUF2062 family)/2-polyprenyl-3-methyl-5-hydroxy-6-metoxy-1,4-benzoquinol methylase